MKTLKLILSNLILVLTLVILTSGTVFADTVTDRYSFEVVADTDENGRVDAYNLKIYEHTFDPVKKVYTSEKTPVGFEDFELFDFYITGKGVQGLEIEFRVTKGETGFLWWKEIKVTVNDIMNSGI